MKNGIAWRLLSVIGLKPAYNTRWGRRFSSALFSQWQRNRPGSRVSSSFEDVSQRTKAAPSVSALCFSDVLQPFFLTADETGVYVSSNPTTNAGEGERIVNSYNGVIPKIDRRRINVCAGRRAFSWLDDGLALVERVGTEWKPRRVASWPPSGCGAGRAEKTGPGKREFMTAEEHDAYCNCASPGSYAPNGKHLLFTFFDPNIVIHVDLEAAKTEHLPAQLGRPRSLATVLNSCSRTTEFGSSILAYAVISA